MMGAGRGKGRYYRPALLATAATISPVQSDHPGVPGGFAFCNHAVAVKVQLDVLGVGHAPPTKQNVVVRLADSARSQDGHIDVFGGAQPVPELAEVASHKAHLFVRRHLAQGGRSGAHLAGRFWGELKQACGPGAWVDGVRPPTRLGLNGLRDGPMQRRYCGMGGIASDFFSAAETSPRPSILPTVGGFALATWAAAFASKTDLTHIAQVCSSRAQSGPLQ